MAEEREQLVTNCAAPSGAHTENRGPVHSVLDVCSVSDVNQNARDQGSKAQILISL